MKKAKKFSITLTTREAHILWGFVDGCLDAGACKDGNTEEERGALSKMANALAAFETEARNTLAEIKGENHE